MRRVHKMFPTSEHLKRLLKGASYTLKDQSNEKHIMTCFYTAVDYNSVDPESLNVKERNDSRLQVSPSLCIHMFRLDISLHSRYFLYPFMGDNAICTKLFANIDKKFEIPDPIMELGLPLSWHLRLIPYRHTETYQ